MNVRYEQMKPLVLLTGVLGLLVAGSTANAQDQPSPPAETQPAETQPAASQPASQPAEMDDLKDIELLDLEIPIVVTAARHEQRITDVPHAISVITADDIRWSGARSIPDALRLVPGIDVAELSYGNYAVSARGFHGMRANKLLVLVDGRQLFDSVNGGTMWGFWPFQLEDIERIEVVRGPGGVTWGANAVNGVINVITKQPKDQEGLTFTATGDSCDSYKPHLGYAFADDKLQFRISGEGEISSGFKRGGTLVGRFHDEMEAGRIGIHAIYTPEPDGKDTLTFSAGSSITGDNWPSSPIADFRPLRPDGQANFVLGKWRHRVAEDNEYEFTAYVNDFHLTPGVRAFDYRYQQYALQFAHTFKPVETHTLTWGLDTRFDYTDATNADPQLLTDSIVRTAILGLYLQDEWRFTTKWTLNLGGRIEYDAYGGFEPSGRAALSYHLSDSSMVYGAVSRAFHMPPAARRFLDFPLTGGIMRVRADHNADAEVLVAYELGYRGRHFGRLDLNLNLFWHGYSDLIMSDTKSGSPGMMHIVGDKRADARLYGAELDAKYPLTKSLTLLGNYTFQYLDWIGEGSIKKTGLLSPPKHKFMVGTRYDLTGDLHLSSHLYFVDNVMAENPILPMLPRYVHSYFRLDLRAEYEFWKDQASFAVGVRNLLDSGHLEGGDANVYAGEVPRMIYAQLRINIQ